MAGTNFLGISPASAVACARAASKRSMWRNVAVSEKASAVLAAEPSAFTRRPAMRSAVGENGLVGAAETDPQAPDAPQVALGAPGRPPPPPATLQHRVLALRQ